MRITTAVLISALCAGCDRPTSPPMPTAAHSASASLGLVSRDDVVMPVEDAVALWNPKDGTIEFLLLPTRLSAEDKAFFAIKDPLFELSKRPSPDPAKWNKYPYASIRLSFKDATGPKTRENVNLFFLLAFSIQKKGMYDTYKKSDDDAPGHISALDLKLDGGGGSVTFASEGREEYFGGTIGWKANLSLPVTLKPQ